VPPISLPGYYLSCVGNSLLFFWFLWQNNFMSRLTIFFLVIIVGLAFGLIYGWVISPVQYRNTTPNNLRYDFQTDFVLMVAEVYNSNQDISLAAQRLAQFGSEDPADLVLRSLAYANQLEYSQPDLELIQNLATALQIWNNNSEGVSP
jgi:hypothetical protein